MGELRNKTRKIKHLTKEQYEEAHNYNIETNSSGYYRD